MRALGILQHRLDGNMAFMHKARRRALWVAVEALIIGGKLWLSALGRSRPGDASDKNSIKAIDRLLGNQENGRELPHLYAALASFLLRKNSKPVLLVDITEVRSGVYALTASLAWDGRGLPLFALVRRQKTIYTRKCQAHFLRTLRAILPGNVHPILVSDAGFESPWFNMIESMGWLYVGRVRGETLFSDGKTWFKCRDLHRQATTRSKNLGTLMFPRTNPRSRRLVLSKIPVPKGRTRLNTSGKPGTRKVDKRCRRAAKEPWLLTTNLTCRASQVTALYGCRMQIEENYRDAKNHRWGWGLDQTRSRSNRRIEMLLLIAALANVVLLSVGCISEQHRLHWLFQANTIRKRRVLSLFVLGRFVLHKQNQRLLNKKDFDDGFDQLLTKVKYLQVFARD